MAETYWVLRLRGRFRWDEGIFTGEKPLAEAAALSEANGGAPVAIFQALPVGEVTARAFASSNETAEQMARYGDDPKGKPEAPGVGKFHAANNLGVHYTCGHSTPEAPADTLIPNDCPVCRKEREEAVDKAIKGTGVAPSIFTNDWWQYEPWKKLIVANADATSFVYAECRHRVPLELVQVPMQCPLCAAQEKAKKELEKPFVPGPPDPPRPEHPRDVA